MCDFFELDEQHDVHFLCVHFLCHYNKQLHLKYQYAQMRLNTVNKTYIPYSKLNFSQLFLLHYLNKTVLKK